MRKRRLGAHGPEVSAIGLGCMGMSQFYGTRDDDQSLRTLRAAIDMGVDLLDTSDVYGNGHNERLIGQAIKGQRDQVVISTKFGARVREDGFVVDGSASYVRGACDASLERLDVDYIDLYYLHRLDLSVPVEETVGAMARLVEVGKVRHLGLSEVGPDILERATRVHPIAALQSEYSIWTRDPERGVLDACRRLGVGFVAFSPLGRGFLTGTSRGEQTLSAEDRRRAFPRFQWPHLQRNLAALEAFEASARTRGTTSAQLALAWLLCRNHDVVPIPGTRRLEGLTENLAAVDISLRPEEVAAIDHVCRPGVFSGERYQPSDLALITQ